MAKKNAKQPPETADERHPPFESGSSRIEVLRREVDRLFDMIHPSDWRLPLVGSSGFELRAPRSAQWQIAPAMNMSESSDAYTITAELPGMSEADVEVKSSQDTLTIKGEKSEEREEQEEDYHISERRFGRFHRSFRFPEGVDASRIDAKMANGVLTITLPKTPDARKAERKIDVKKA